VSQRDLLAEPAFQSRFDELLGALGEGIVQDHTFVTIPSNRPPWSDSGVTVEAGDRVTTFAIGRTRLEGTDISIGPAFQLWFRIGPDGEIFRGTRDTHTFDVAAGGRLYLASYFPGEWGTRTGDLGVPAAVYEQVSGSLSVLVVRWLSDPLEGLVMLAALGDVGDLIATEMDRLTAPILPPEGWYYKWFLGPAEIYRSYDAPGREGAISCHTNGDCGLLLRDVSLPLKPNTRLRWSWKMDVLPSEVREDSLLTHDYMSIAVEFDNGQDITYFWSAELPVGTGFRCPIPLWAHRETHVTIRSGQRGLGTWLSEERDVYEDYVNHVGGPAGASVVRVWLIALTLFQGREGIGQYADITFVADGELIPVR
jgi:hypothetical protein